MQQVDAREELGQLVRAFRLYLERQARSGAYTVSAAPMPPVALADDGEHGEPGPDDWQDGSPEGWRESMPESLMDEPRAAQARREDFASQGRPPARHAPGPDLDEPMPSFEAALMAVLDEPAPKRAPRAPEQARPSTPQEARPTYHPTYQGVPQDAPPRTLADVRDDLGDCQRCKLAGQRTNIVFGVGAPDAALMFIGEAPGADEDRRGEPFVGAAGKLLDLMIQAMGWTRDTVYIANVLKCRPPGNRDPQPDEVAACQPFLARQIEAVAPRVIVTLGKPATQLILQTDAPISALRGRFQEYRGIRVMPTFHPAFLLRTPERKRDTWSDLKLVIAELDRLGVPSPRPPKT
jgi:uracil-DNA glycosylase family 4